MTATQEIDMPQQSRSDAIRVYFAAFKSGDRAHLEQALAADFTFTSPYDDGIDKATYFARCWPNRNLISEHVVERIFEQGDEAFVLYRCKTTDGKELHNTEFFTFEGDRLKGVQVFFGAAYRNDRFVQQQQS
jgi:ketosteroid isomerase-like protein